MTKSANITQISYVIKTDAIRIQYKKLHNYLDSIVEEYLRNKTNAKKFSSCLIAGREPEDKSPKKTTTKKGEKQPCKKPTCNRVDTKVALKMRKSGATLVDIAKKFGVNESSIRRAIKKASM